MMELTIDQRKQLIEKYPYLQPRNLWTGKISDDYDFSYIRGESELPSGWFKLFLMYCKDIRQHLVEANMLEKFQFSQIKEKYGSMRLYNFGYPETILKITHMYRYMSQFICHRCGNFARYESYDYILPWCEHCTDNECFIFKKLYRPSVLYIEHYENHESYKTAYSIKPLIKKYKKLLELSDDQFLEYILT